MDKATFNALPDDEKVRTLEGTAYYSHLHRPDMKQAKRFSAVPVYHTSLGLDEAGVEKAKSWGLRVIEANDYIPIPHIKIKRKVKDESDPEASRPDIVDAVQNKVPDSVLVGNGSRAAVKFGTYWYDNLGGGVGTAMFKFQVLDLVPYEASAPSTDADLTVDTDGWTIGDDTPTTDESIFDED